MKIRLIKLHGVQMDPDKRRQGDEAIERRKHGQGRARARATPAFVTKLTDKDGALCCVALVLNG